MKSKEEIISFKTAVLAHEKGFFKSPKDHGKVFGSWYNERGIQDGRSDIDESGQEINYSTYGQDYRKHYLKTYYAPTQSFLHKWLRDQCLFFVKITNHSLTQWYYELVDLSYKIPLKKLRFLEQGEEFEFDTYEKALEAGMCRALELLTKPQSNE